MAGYTPEEIDALMSQPRKEGVYRFVLKDGSGIGQKFILRLWDGYTWHSGNDWNVSSGMEKLKHVAKVTLRGRDPVGGHYTRQSLTHSKEFTFIMNMDGDFVFKAKPEPQLRLFEWQS